MNSKKYINTLMMAGGLGTMLSVGLGGCSSSEQNQSLAQKQNAFVIIEELENGRYAIAEEFPAKKTTIVLRQKDGKERILSKEEIDEIIKKENEKIQNGTSPLTNPQMTSGNMGLGGVLLSSVAGAMIGSWIGNKLFANQNFQNQRAANYKNPQAYSRSKNSFAKAKRARSAKKSGFFGSSSKKRSGSFFGG